MFITNQEIPFLLKPRNHIRKYRPQRRELPYLLKEKPCQFS